MEKYRESQKNMELSIEQSNECKELFDFTLETIQKDWNESEYGTISIMQSIRINYDKNHNPIEAGESGLYSDIYT